MLQSKIIKITTLATSKDLSLSLSHSSVVFFLTNSKDLLTKNQHQTPIKHYNWNFENPDFKLNGFYLEWKEFGELPESTKFLRTNSYFIPIDLKKKGKRKLPVVVLTLSLYGLTVLMVHRFFFYGEATNGVGSQIDAGGSNIHEHCLCIPLNLSVF